jgi:hypothetical protein
MYMMWAALRDSDTDLFMRAPIEEVTRHLARERGDCQRDFAPADRQAGYPGSFSFDPTSIARPSHLARHY